MGIRTEYRLKETFDHNILSVIYDADSFFYVVSDLQNQLISAVKYEIEGNSSEEIKEIIRKENLSDHLYTEVRIFNRLNDFTFVPVNEYDYKNEDAFVRNAFDSTSQQRSIDLYSGERIHIVHESNDEILEALSSITGNRSVNHVSLAWLESIHEDGLYAFKDKGFLSIFVMQNDQFQFYNQFSIKTSQDALYFIMLVFQKLNLDVETFRIYVEGLEVEELKQTLKDYIVNVDSTSMGFSNIEDSSTIFDLYLVSICE